MEPGSAPVSEPSEAAAAEPAAERSGPAAVAATPRQRWRLVLARDAGPAGVAGRELADAWESALDTTGLPLQRASGKGRARIAFGAPVPAALALERELADIVLTEFVPRFVVREALAGRLPVGWRLVDLFDVWLGEPALAGQVAAADYRIDLGGADAVRIAEAASVLLAGDRLPRERIKGGITVEYDLRPLLIDVAVADPGPPLIVRTRTRFHPVLGTGRPEEVVAALVDGSGIGLTPESVIREGLILAESLRPRLD